MTPSDRYAHYHQELEEIIANLKAYIKSVEGEIGPNDYKNLTSLHADLADRERRHALNEMYMGENIAAASEEVAINKDPRVVSSLTAMLRAI